MNEEYVAVTFERQVDLENLSKVQDLMRWCRRQIDGAAGQPIKRSMSFGTPCRRIACRVSSGCP